MLTIALLAACASAGGPVFVHPVTCRSPLPLRPTSFARGYGLDQRRDYRRFLDALIAELEPGHGLTLRDVRLYADYGPPPSRADGIVAGELVCQPAEASGRWGRYQIRIYRDALLGEDVARLYNTIAHELRHAVQDAAAPHQVRCGQLRDRHERAEYEREASEWADRVAPLCRFRSDAD